MNEKHNEENMEVAVVVVELDDLQLVFVGGGIGETTL
jgi:hypothetical protein